VSLKNQLIEKLSDRSAVIGIIGLGYVGLPLAIRYVYDCAVIGTDHDVFDFDLIFSDAPLVVDTRGRARNQDKHVFRA
jgi:UDP-N-acetyl-D-glucosamine dehydrogenase